MKEFKDSKYLEDIRKKIPGYDLLQEVFCKAILTEEEKHLKMAEVLSIGGQAGEIYYLLEELGESSLTLVEPEPAMIELVKSEVGDERIRYICDFYENYEHGKPFDLCVCLLVLQFVKDEKAFLKKIYRDLREGGVLFLSLFSDEQLSYWKNFALYKGGNRQQVERTYQSQKEVMKALSSQDVEKMLTEIGFTCVQRVFQCLSVYGWVVKK